MNSWRHLLILDFDSDTLISLTVFLTCSGCCKVVFLNPGNNSVLYTLFVWYFGSFGVAELLGALLLYQTGNLATTKDFALSDKFILVFPPNNGISH